jgi:hypothetical protein
MSALTQRGVSKQVHVGAAEAHRLRFGADARRISSPERSTT